MHRDLRDERRYVVNALCVPASAISCSADIYSSSLFPSLMITFTFTLFMGFALIYGEVFKVIIS